MKAAPHPSAAPPLAGLLAGMRAETAQLAAQAGIVAMLHALIMSCLTRLVGRLDDLMTLWLSGQLPAPDTAIPSAAKDPSSLSIRRSPATTGPRLPYRPRAIGPRAIVVAHTAAPAYRTPQFRGAMPLSSPPERAPLHHIRRRKPPWA